MALRRTETLADLRAGWTMRDGYPWCDLPYSSEVGLLVAEGDDEF
ncbi:hypothetical protein [uncultured Methanofollis sp.]|nr:hypothetical protein [uncultured Methanofollis sp.]